MASKVLPDGPTHLVPIPATDAALWETTATGVDAKGIPHTLTRVDFFQAENPGNGRLAFGKRTLRADGGPENGRHGWMWVDRGGAVVMLFAIIANALYIGTIENERGLIDPRSESDDPAERAKGLVVECPRGFHDNEHNDPILTAASETLEEAGVDLRELVLTDLTEAAGIKGGGNPNSTFFDTTKGNGVAIVAGEVPLSWLEAEGETYRFRSERVKRVEGSANAAIGDRVMRCRFRQLGSFATPDFFTNAAVGFLVPYLLQKSRLQLRFS